jgi:hypothetical protein
MPGALHTQCMALRHRLSCCATRRLDAQGCRDTFAEQNISNRRIATWDRKDRLAHPGRRRVPDPQDDIGSFDVGAKFFDAALVDVGQARGV